MAFLVNSSSKMLRLTFIQLLLLIYSSLVLSTFTLHDFCSDETIRMSQLENYLWEYVEVKSIRSSSPSPLSNKKVPASTDSNPTEIQKYLFSPCIPLQNHGLWPKYNHSACANSMVCFIRTFSNGSVVAEGYGPNGSASSVSTLHSMYLEGNECEFFNVTKKVAINFSCDKYHGLGKPIKSYSAGCSVHFNWPSIAACTDSNINRPQLSKCYVYDDQGNERDLSPLIHKTGYEVVAPSHSLAQFAHLAVHLDKRELNGHEGQVNSGFYINVCSEVKHHCDTGPSESGHLACYRNASRVLPLGNMKKTTIEFDKSSGEVVLTSSVPTGEPNNDDTVCPDGMKSVIRFKCPHNSATEVDSYGALGSRRPFVVATSTCEVIIEWETDYACPTQTLEGNYRTCIIRDESTQRQIDLSPLKLLGYQTLSNLSINFDDYTGHPSDASDEIVFKVCDSFNITESIHPTHCGQEWAGSSVCFRSTSGETARNSVIGSLTDAKFRYADGLVSLRYPTRKGTCVSPHFAHLSSESDGPSTLINFPCNESAGLGSPVFLGYDDCFYKIEWPTNLTCHKQNLSYSYRLMTPCTVSYNGSFYDLSLLRKRQNQTAWQASVANSVLAKDQSLGEKSILLNVCSKLPKISKLELNITKITSLPENVAVILHSKANGPKSLGRDISSPEWDEKSGGLVLRYIDNINTSAGQVMVRSTIRFSCAPGILDSSPQLTKVSRDAKSESYEFFWPTASACPIHEHRGTDCQVTVPNLSTVLDLNPLAQDGLFSHVTEDQNYKYYINVCGPLGNSPCHHKEDSSLAGICQVSKANPNRMWILGQANSNLTYWDGVLSLTYTNGDKYNDPNKTPRSAHLSFVCSDRDSLEMILETNRTYFFRYYTKHACPNAVNMVPCLWTNGTHSVDLGRISIEQGQNHYAARASRNNSGESVVAFLNICRPLNRFVPSKLNCRHGSAACKIVYAGGGTSSFHSLGIPMYPPVLHGDQLALIYTNGDPCPKNNSVRLSSKLLFFCDPIAYEPIVEIVTSKNDECIEVFHVRTNETCGVFPPPPPFASKKPPTNGSANSKGQDPKTMPSQTDESVKQFPSGFLLFMLFASTLVIIAVLAIMAFPNTRTAVTSRVRTWVCGQITSSNPIHYSQVSTDSRSQLVPLKELNNELNGDRLAFIPISTSDSPYNPTTAPFDGETDQMSSNCISHTLHGSKIPSPSSQSNGTSHSPRHTMPLNKSISTNMSQEENESMVDLLK